VTKTSSYVKVLVREGPVRVIKGSIADRKGIKFSGNPDATDYCERHDIFPLANNQLDRKLDSSKDKHTDVFDTPGRYLVDSLS
jgi:hypothetical protein